MAEFRGFSSDFRDSLSCSVGILFVFSLVILSVSCGSREQSQVEQEKALRQRVEEQAKQVEEDLIKAREVSQRAYEEAVRAKQERSLMIGLGIACGVIALVVGTAMGSKARRDARNQRQHSEKEGNGPMEGRPGKKEGGDPVQTKPGTTEGGDPIDGKPEWL